MKTFSLLLATSIAIFLLTACNIVKIADHKAVRTFEQNDMEQRTFTDAAGPHFTWVTKDINASSKPKLMLVHGITSSANMWASNLAVLRARYDLVVPDLIGHGHSTTNWSGNSVDVQVAHLNLILDSLHIHEPVYIVGNSYGGAMAANYAEQHPDRTHALVIYDGPASDYTSAIADSVARSVGAKDITDLFTPKNKEEQGRLLSLVTFTPPKVPGFVLKQLNTTMKEHGPAYLALLKDLLQREDQYATKRYNWTMPVYVIWGEGDRLIPLATGRGIAKRNALPADHLIVIPKAGHVSSIEQPDLFNGSLFRILVDGPCPDPVQRAAFANTMCTAEYAPVCGCDGKTYPNACAARKEGVRVVHFGECK